MVREKSLHTLGCSEYLSISPKQIASPGTLFALTFHQLRLIIAMEHQTISRYDFEDDFSIVKWTDGNDTSLHISADNISFRMLTSLTYAFHFLSEKNYMWRKGNGYFFSENGHIFTRSILASSSITFLVSW